MNENENENENENVNENENEDDVEVPPFSPLKKTRTLYKVKTRTE